MLFSVLLCFLVTVHIPFCNSHLTQETRYECGPHGQFEYCIDGIPGCVIGCHCHPGYYFDTDTKICEPNVKLTQDFRRHYFAEPTRVYAPPVHTPTATEPIPTLPTNNQLDGNVDEIVNKDTSDIGDWLYNQFFKTIENQVINNSNNTNTETKVKDKPLTRRSGGDTKQVVNKRKSRKSVRGSKKKKHMKVHGLRRKLLRITEDDSLFDSESNSDSSDSSDDSSSGDSDDSGSSTSDESADGNGKKPTPDGKDHGHKKVIIFNRRPRPPLPSFIFLPGMDTPYYPPIGLPPPPMPMYPMVPVPPMAPPIFFPGPPKCDDGESNTTTTSTQTTTTQAADTTTTDTTTTEATSETTTVSTTTVDPNKLRRSRIEKHRNKRPMQQKIVPRSKESSNLPKLRLKQRNKLMQKLREKMKVNRLDFSPIDTQTEDELQDGESPVLDDIPISHEAYISSHKSPVNHLRQGMPKLEDVDFKYLSELIHRVNQSESRNKLSSLPFDLNQDLKQLKQIQSQHTRRNFDPYSVEPANEQTETNHHRSLHRQGSDDVYYTNLGRKIASMIRDADSKVEVLSNKETEHANHHVQFHPVLNQNSYMPHSFWERSVRSSPSGQINELNINYLDESRTLKHSNEKNLLNLENAVEIFASTPPPLTLRDLENILSTMQKVHAHIKYKNPVKSTSQSNTSLNVNLLPKYTRADSTFRRSFNSPDYGEYLPYLAPKNYADLEPKNNIELGPKSYGELIPKRYVEMPANNYEELVPQNYIVFDKNNYVNIPTTNTTIAPNNTVIQAQNRNVILPVSNYWMYNNNRNQKPMSVMSQNITDTQLHGYQLHNLKPTRKPDVRVVDAYSNNNLALKPPAEYLQFLRKMPVIKQANSKRPTPLLLSSPPEVNYKTLNYFAGNKHHYMFEQATYPLRLASFKRQISRPSGKFANPSYFHHELHHFDYFD